MDDMTYERIPIKINLPVKGGKVTKMTKSTVKEAPAEYAKTRGEHNKDIVIALLVAGIIAFVGGMTFQSKQQSAIDTAVKAITPSVSAQAPASK